MDRIFAPLRKALEVENGHALAEVFSPIPPASDPGRLYAIARAASPFTIQSEIRSSLKYISVDQASREAWLDILLNFWKCTLTITEAEESTQNNSGVNHATSLDTKQPDHTKVYTSWKDLLNSLHRAYSQGHLEPWTLPLLYIVTRHLRLFAIRADAIPSPGNDQSAVGVGLDDVAAPTPGGAQANLEDAARQINRIFALVTQDRSPPPNRKYGTYYIATLLFKTYFRLHSLSLCKNIIRTIDAAALDIPPLETFPKSHRVGYGYFAGVVDFLEERYAAAEDKLSAAWGLCPADDRGAAQAERILTYLVPTRLITKHQLPTAALLARHPGLQALFGPLCEATRRGNLRLFDDALAAGEEVFVRMRVYLTLERGRDVCLRNLLRRVYLAAGYEAGKDGSDGTERVRRSRIAVAEFVAGMRVVGEDLEADEVEALIAGMIYKNLMKGYISRAHSMVVLNKKGAFPGTGV